MQARAHRKRTGRSVTRDGRKRYLGHCQAHLYAEEKLSDGASMHDDVMRDPLRNVPGVATARVKFLSLVST